MRSFGLLLLSLLAVTAKDCCLCEDCEDLPTDKTNALVVHPEVDTCADLQQLLLVVEDSNVCQETVDRHRESCCDPNSLDEIFDLNEVVFEPYELKGDELKEALKHQQAYFSSNSDTSNLFDAQDKLEQLQQPDIAWYEITIRDWIFGNPEKNIESWSESFHRRRLQWSSWSASRGSSYSTFGNTNVGGFRVNNARPTTYNYRPTPTYNYRPTPTFNYRPRPAPTPNYAWRPTPARPISYPRPAPTPNYAWRPTPARPISYPRPSPAQPAGRPFWPARPTPVNRPSPPSGCSGVSCGGKCNGVCRGKSIGASSTRGFVVGLPGRSSYNGSCFAHESRLRNTPANDQLCAYTQAIAQSYCRCGQSPQSGTTSSGKTLGWTIKSP